MYNIFKRPMFKLGGQADQGTGIMSTVEPKQTMRQNPYTGYAIGGRIGYAQAGPVKFQDSPFYKPGMGIMESREAYDQYIADRNKKLFEEDPGIQKYMQSIEPRPISERESILKILRDQGAFSDVRGRPTFVMEEEAIKKFKEGDVEKTSKSFEAQARDEERAALARTQPTVPSQSKLPPGMKDNEYDDTSRSKPFNLLDEVRRESGELKEILGRDDDILKAEAAYVLSEALGTPGTIAQKIQKGLKAAVPLKKAKAEQDKAITLTAYKLAKEKEQQQIRAGTLPTSIREAEYIARSLKESGDPRYAGMSVQQIMNENIRAARPMSPESKARTEVLLADRQIIRDTTNSLLKAKGDLEKLDPVKDKAKYDKTKELYDRSFRQFERDYLSAPEFKSLYEGIYNIFAPQMTSRTMKAGGGLTEDENEPDVVTSNVNFGGTTTPIKPVQKLDYATLRDRLPKEINDQVVQLLASSEQALQDFAYITSQNDVNNFNVKYGVNLIIPPAQQTS